jgi:anti-anti-sigma factor
VRLADVEFGSRGIDVIARVTGEIDLSNAIDLESALVGAVSNHSRALIVDLSNVRYLDSAGIQLIYRLRESLHARRQRLAVVIPKGSPAHDALRLAGVAEHVETIETLDDATHALE